jgi:hypothetical protein
MGIEGCAQLFGGSGLIAREFGAEFEDLQEVTRPLRYPEIRLMPLLPTILFALALAAA